MPRKTYTPEERAERRRRSSYMPRKPSRPPVDAGGSADEEESWIADLRAQGVDVTEFLKVAPPPRTIDVPDNPRPPRASRVLSLARQPSGQSDSPEASDSSDVVKERFSGFLDKSYVFDEAVGDLVMLSAEDVSQKRWEKEMEEDSKNYDPRGTTEEKVKKNKEWALKMALRRAAQAGFTPAPVNMLDTQPPERPIFPKVPPPPTEPLPEIDDRDFDAVSEPRMNPRELGISPPSLPHRLIDLVPKIAVREAGIATGFVVAEGYEDEPYDSETMVVSCKNCGYYLYCPRVASLVRCEACSDVTPACPVVRRGDDVTEENGDPAATGSTPEGLPGWADDSTITFDTEGAVRFPVQDPGRGRVAKSLPGRI